MLETALKQEMTERLGHEKRAPGDNGNVRQRAMAVLTEASGQVGCPGAGTGRSSRRSPASGSGG